MNQKLKPISEVEKSHCFDQRTVNCSSEVVPEEVQKQERRERKVPDSKRKCRMVQKKADGLLLFYPVSSLHRSYF